MDDFAVATVSFFLLLLELAMKFVVVELTLPMPPVKVRSSPRTETEFVGRAYGRKIRVRGGGY
jgi:hypothetical protein